MQIYRVASFPGARPSFTSSAPRQGRVSAMRRRLPLILLRDAWPLNGKSVKSAGCGGAAGLSADNAGSVATWLFMLSFYPRSAQRGEGAPPRLAARRLRDKEARRGALCSDRGDRGGLSSASPRYRALCRLVRLLEVYYMNIIPHDRRFVKRF